ncbi:PGF-CTERM sorting domain-containing protein [Halorussus amylolyticus]|uniref:PGF-CTERM sorting domain-containing protein n=1 Tax=Halorussus amylolyticus TaxID=1126242 RepID=UPI001045F679|nr:PGF-CTERM sorting domain-containing protein [Halorussus amylolyticus]
MRRREFLGGAVGVAALSTVGIAAGHEGPYRPLGSVSIPKAAEAVPDEAGEFAYVAAMDGFAVVDIMVPSDPVIVAEERDLFADRETGPLRQIQDVKVEGDTLLVAGPADPKIGEVLQGVVVYDVSDPENPEQVGFFETDYPIHNCHLRDEVAYLTGNNGEDNPLVTVDVSDDDPEEIGRWSMLDRDEAWGEVESNLRQIHDVWVGDGRAYLAHWDAGTWILDVSDPANPEYVAQVGGRPRDELAEISEEDAREHVLRPPGNDHYSMPNEDGTLLGINKESWEADGEGGPGGVELWDISDVEDPERLSAIEAPPSPDPTISGTWTTSHNFDIVGDRLFSSWYQGGVKIHDISDPANPEELIWWRMPDEAAFWTAKLATDRFFVASSTGRLEGSEGALYTFENAANHESQKNPPSLTTTANQTAGDAETTQTTTEEAALADDTATAEESSGSVPGFGIPAALAALLGVGAWRRLRE